MKKGNFEEWSVLEEDEYCISGSKIKYPSF